MTERTSTSIANPVPIACSLEPDSAQARIARWQALADRALEESARTTEGAWQRYRADPGVESELVELIALEGRCCSFLAFELTRRDDGLELHVQGPETAHAMLDAFATGSQPV